MTDKIKEVFEEIKKECIKLNMSRDRLQLLTIIEVEAGAGLPFADKLKKYFPEVVK